MKYKIGFLGMGTVPDRRSGLWALFFLAGLTSTGSRSMGSLGAFRERFCCFGGEVMEPTLRIRNRVNKAMGHASTRNKPMVMAQERMGGSLGLRC